MNNLVKNPKLPITIYKKDNENLVEVKTLSGFSVLACGECGTLHRSNNSFESALNCCKSSYCACGSEKYPYWPICANCLRKKDTSFKQERLDKAEIVEHSGWIYADGFGSNEGYFESVDNLIDSIGESEELPEFAYICIEKHFKNNKLDAIGILENRLSDYHEDAIDQLDVNSLQKLLDLWLAEQVLISYEPDYSKKVKVK